ncbi:unnamed protein product [Phaedon cochleariae]|uniref:TAFII55 protein conserved region domain-containing protein n=1 Tax=Phaedon cochleariae TaxID=80249 RepID=A0A9P0GQV0_PHACE|nr:unnamed protein product [Phaedon cochleariae]
MDIEEEKTMLEEQFILRIPSEEAHKIRAILRTKPEKLKKILKFAIDPNTNKVITQISKLKLYGTLKKLPTIVESYKTNICNNKSVMFKTADICHIADCSYEEKPKEKIETIHGLTLPLKNVKRKRFRKTMYNADTAVEAEAVSKELYYLLSTDLEAVSSKFEILYENGSGPNVKKQCGKKKDGRRTFSFLCKNSNNVYFHLQKKRYLDNCLVIPQRF